MSGIKHDQGKPDFTYLSWEMLEEVAKVRAFGARKYSPHGWKDGFKVTRSCAAALRHIFQFLNGESVDAESGLSHLAHAICSLEHAIYDMKHRPENDDRWIGRTKAAVQEPAVHKPMDRISVDEFAKRIEGMKIVKAKPIPEECLCPVGLAVRDCYEWQCQHYHGMPALPQLHCKCDCHPENEQAGYPSTL